MKKFIVLITIVILGLGLCANLMADTHYVDLNGSNTSPYTTPETAVHTITDAMSAAATGDIIDVTGTITENVFSGIQVNKNLTIQGQGTGSTIVQAHASENTATDRVFEITSGETIAIIDMTIRHGKTTAHGGGIYNEGTLRITNCTVSGNSCADRSGGSIIHMWGMLTLIPQLHNKRKRSIIICRRHLQRCYSLHQKHYPR